MNTPRAADAAPLDDQLLVMDVVDTLRHGIDLPPARPVAPSDEALIERLRGIYRQQGMEVSDAVLGEGIAAMADGRFTYRPAGRLAGLIGRAYVSRHAWQRPAVALGLALVIGLGGYFLAYRPYKASQAEAARMQLSQDLPAQMDSLYQTIFNETKVQNAAQDADELRNRGKEAAQQGNRAAAERSVAELTALRDRLEQAYTLKVVDRDGVRPGFWRFPPNNTEATNYYLVVEAVDADGKALSLPVASEETGLTQTVSQWGVRVPQAVYDAVIADKQDNGVIEHNLVGFKQDGFVDVDYLVPVLGGAVTQW